MRFYTSTHQYYCGIDLHTRVMYLCIIRDDGEIVPHRNMKAEPESLLKAIKPYRPDLVIGVECIFTWYWIADLCAEEGIPFVPGPCPLHESDSWWKSQERQNRFCKDRCSSERRHLPHGLRLSQEDEGNKRPSQEKELSGEKEGRSDKPHSEHKQSVQL
mgnify:CR=1 FL=1